MPTYDIGYMMENHKIEVAGEAKKMKSKERNDPRDECGALGGAFVGSKRVKGVPSSLRQESRPCYTLIL